MNIHGPLITIRTMRREISFVTERKIDEYKTRMNKRYLNVRLTP